MKVYSLGSDVDRNAVFEKIAVTEAGKKILLDKTNVNCIYIKNLRTPAANILKQDALSIGADLAVSGDTITCKEQFTDALLIANDAHLKVLSKKELAQPFGLKDLAKKLKNMLTCTPKKVKIMAVLNTNEDSFYKKSRFNGKEALEQIEQMIEDGADIIDLGGVSSRPGSVGVSPDEELRRIAPVIDLVYERKLFEKVDFSLDSYAPKCVEYALQRGFRIINDITALQDDAVAKLVAKHDATVVLMHKLGDTESMQENPQYEDVIIEIEEFFQARIEKAKSFGIENIVLDVGIGFGKMLHHNLLLLKHHKHFLHLGYPLLVGASRKSMIDKIIPSSTEERLPGTLAIHLKAVENGASIIRVHDVKEHFQALKVQEAINKASL